MKLGLNRKEIYAIRTRNTNNSCTIHGLTDIRGLCTDETRKGRRSFNRTKEVKERLTR